MQIHIQIHVFTSMQWQTVCVINQHFWAVDGSHLHDLHDLKTIPTVLSCWISFDRNTTPLVEDIISSFPAPGVIETNNLSEITEVGKMTSEKIT